MLLRYAVRVGEGHGVVWNIGEAPVDGATDFLFMMMVGGLARLGLEVEIAARVLTLWAHALTLVGVYLVHLRRPQGTVWGATLSALVIATGPALCYCEALFGTTVFALGGLVTYACFLRLMDHAARPRLATGFALAGILTALIRPEGGVLVMGMLASLLWYLRGEVRRLVLRRFLLLFCLPGLVYFSWHWLYFGYPLPNPFYVKGGGGLYLPSLKASFIAVVKMGSVLLPILAWAAWKKDARRKTLLLMAPIMLFAVAWILMSNAMNFHSRFQYILMPLMWVAWAPMVEMMRPGFALKGRWLWVALPLVGLVITAHYLLYSRHPRIHEDGRASLGTALARWKDSGYVMAVTEAGNLPFHSKWPAVDTWGLNDRHIAHAGVVDQAYLDQYRPALIMVHDHWSPGVAKQRPEPAWGRMTDTLEAYARQHDYALVACWGRLPHSAHFYYLRKDIPDFAVLRSLVASTPYAWYEDGYPAENFLQAP